MSAVAVQEMSPTPDPRTGPVRILVVDDSGTNRLVMQSMLEHEGYQVLLAEDGQQAVDVFEQEQPDLVLMDNHMPVMDGYEATRIIKSRTRADFVPVIFLAALSDQDALIEALDCGGDDILGKPYNRGILSAKLRSFLRVRELYAIQRRQTDELAQYNEQIRNDQRVAENVFNNIVRSGELDSPSIHYIVSPTEVFNGDVLLAATTPSGELHVLVGDFTGHGLSAALGAMPASEIFYGMTAKGFAPGDIVAEINSKLRTLLPTGMFLAVCLIKIELGARGATVWNAGLPDVLVTAESGGIKHHVESAHLPLGVVSTDELDSAGERVELMEGDRLYVYTDGVIEARNDQGEVYGQDRLSGLVSAASEKGSAVPRIESTLREFAGGAEQNDDITLIELVCDRYLAEARQEREKALKVARKPTSWKAGMTLRADALRQVDPLPLLTQLMMEVQGLEQHRERLFTVLAEMFSNALDHGLLGLDSRLKASAEGFMEYYQQREIRLGKLSDAEIEVELEHVPHGSGGRLTLRIRDTGPGFDLTAKRTSLDENTGASGRGLALIGSICEKFRHYGNGNQAEAVYVWES